MDDLKSIYTIKEDNWYEAKPYGFRHNDVIMPLPMAPNNLTISTGFATNVISTLYGTVEEHSEVKYYDIVIEGTTGIAPKYYKPIGRINDETNVSHGRKSFSVNSLIKEDKFGGWFKKTLNLVNKAAQKATEIFGDPEIQTGVYDYQTGYVAFHNLYRYLLNYKKNVTSNKGSPKSLVFFNYKDNVEYNVVIRNFSLRRSADNPMLYNYSISMRGYNMRSIGMPVSKKGAEDKLKELGLTGVQSSSLLATIKKKAAKARALANLAGGAIPNFGK